MATALDRTACLLLVLFPAVHVFHSRRYEPEMVELMSEWLLKSLPVQRWEWLRVGPTIRSCPV